MAHQEMVDREVKARAVREQAGQVEAVYLKEAHRLVEAHPEGAAPLVAAENLAEACPWADRETVKRSWSP